MSPRISLFVCSCWPRELIANMTVYVEPTNDEDALYVVRCASCLNIWSLISKRNCVFSWIRHVCSTVPPPRGLGPGPGFFFLLFFFLSSPRFASEPCSMNYAGIGSIFSCKERQILSRSPGFHREEKSASLKTIRSRFKKGSTAYICLGQPPWGAGQGHCGLVAWMTKVDQKVEKIDFSKSSPNFTKCFHET